MATATGPLPTGTVVTTVFVAVSIAETLLEFKFVTYAKAPFGVIARLHGPAPNARGTVAVTVLVTVLITETLLELKFAT
jgi:hypothetical protein